MTETHEYPVHSSLAELREHARHLAHELTGSLRRVSVRSGETVIEVEWQHGDAMVAPPAVNGAGDHGAADGHTADVTNDPAESTTPITSPMVGTFYRAAGPGEPPFVEIGDTVQEGQTVGIVEAMKLFNPIVAECSGTVTEILVGNAGPVEFGQELIRVSVTELDDGSGETEPE